MGIRIKESEKRLELKLGIKIKELGGWSIKLLPYIIRGLPDRLCLLPGGRVFFAEIKTTGEKPNKNQNLIIAKLRSLGFPVYVIDNSEYLNEIIETWASR